MKIAAMILGILGSVMIGLVGYAVLDANKRSLATRAQLEREVQGFEELEKRLGSEYGYSEDQKQSMKEAISKTGLSKTTLLRAYGLMGLAALGFLTALFVFKTRASGGVLLGIGAVAFFVIFQSWLGSLLLVIAGVLSLWAKRAVPVA